MHKYLRAVGFSEIANNDELKKLLETCVAHNDSEAIQNIPSAHGTYAELRKEIADRVGIACRGHVYEDCFEFEYFYPYLVSENPSSSEDIFIERQAERECYSGAIEDNRIGVTVIFFLQNMIEYMNLTGGKGLRGKTQLALTGLSIDGTVLLPARIEDEEMSGKIPKASNRTSLIEKAKNGDQSAIESLTMEDMDTYTMISKRIKNEDVYSIVDTCFMPYGMECDKYTVIGTIENVETLTNKMSGEELYRLQIVTNDLPMEICMNKNDLFGEPAVGRRFKGVVWLQGKILV